MYESSTKSIYRVDLETSVDEIKKELSGKCTITDRGKNRDHRISGVTTDSRSIKRNNLFFALEGEKFDGHNFVSQAKNKNAIGAVVSSRKVDKELMALVDRDFFLISVKDSSSFLLDFAYWHRSKFNPFITSIVGSNGKTTSKEMIAHILGSVFRRNELVVTHANQNNHIGVPLNLLRINDKTKHVILEVGMNAIGEIDRLAHMVRPNLVLMTNAQRDHQEFLNSVSLTARENGRAIEALQPNGIAVLPRDSDYTDLWSDQANRVDAEIVRFGIQAEFDNVREENNRDFIGRIVEKFPLIMEVQSEKWLDTFKITLKGIGKHFASNALGAVAVAACLKIPDRKIFNSLKNFLPVNGRGVIYSLQNSVFLIDDTYNANPDSMVAAIHAMGDLKVTKCAVLADMHELGEKSGSAHAEVLCEASQKLEKIFLLGEEFAKVSKRLGYGTPCAGKDSLINKIKEWIKEQCKTQPNRGIAVWLKGSRSNGLEDVVKDLLEKGLN